MVENNLRWYVIWYPEVNGWAVMLGNFRDSWFYTRHEAEERMDCLQKQDIEERIKEGRI